MTTNRLDHRRVPNLPHDAGAGYFAGGPGTTCDCCCRVDAAALRRGHTEAGELCDVAGLGPIPVADLGSFLPRPPSTSSSPTASTS